MDEKVLSQMLSHSAFVAESDSRYTAKEGFDVTVILATQTATSINKVKSIELSGALCTLMTDESTYLLPWAQIFAIRVGESGTVKSSRTGFRA